MRVSATLGRDPLELADLRRLDDVERLLRLLATQSANLLSYRKIGTRLDMHHGTVQAYVALLEQMFLVKRLPAGDQGRAPGRRRRRSSTCATAACSPICWAPASNGSRLTTRSPASSARRSSPASCSDTPRGRSSSRVSTMFRAGIVVYAGEQTIPLGRKLWAVPYSGLWA